MIYLKKFIDYLVQTNKETFICILKRLQENNGQKMF